jgi:predicted phage tail protein
MTTTIIKGRSKGGSNQTRTPVEAPDSIQSIARAKVLIALGGGEFAGGLDGKNIFLVTHLLHASSERRRKL